MPFILAVRSAGTSPRLAVRRDRNPLNNHDFFCRAQCAQRALGSVVAQADPAIVEETA